MGQFHQRRYIPRRQSANLVAFANWHSYRLTFGVLAALFVLATIAAADVVTITDGRDTTLIEEENGSLANGAGPHFTVGRTGQVTGSIRRGLLWFDISSKIPAGATIDSVTLELNVSQVPFSSTARDIALRRALVDWGEGVSNAGSPGGQGAAAQAGDAPVVMTGRAECLVELLHQVDQLEVGRCLERVVVPHERQRHPQDR